MRMSMLTALTLLIHTSRSSQGASLRSERLPKSKSFVCFKPESVFWSRCSYFQLGIFKRQQQTSKAESPPSSPLPSRSSSADSRRSGQDYHRSNEVFFYLSRFTPHSSTCQYDDLPLYKGVKPSELVKSIQMGIRQSIGTQSCRRLVQMVVLIQPS